MGRAGAAFAELTKVFLNYTRSSPTARRVSLAPVL
jgi:hypothetical protein